MCGSVVACVSTRGCVRKRERMCYSVVGCGNQIAIDPTAAPRAVQ